MYLPIAKRKKRNISTAFDLRFRLKTFWRGKSLGGNKLYVVFLLLPRYAIRTTIHNTPAYRNIEYNNV